MSRTRQQTLPPKTRQDDQRPSQDFKSMMRSFHDHDIKRQKEDREKQRRKEEELAQSTRVWESATLRGEGSESQRKQVEVHLVERRASQSTGPGVEICHRQWTHAASKHSQTLRLVCPCNEV